MKHVLGRQRQRVIKRLRRAKEVQEAEDRKIAMRLEQANQASFRLRHSNNEQRLMLQVTGEGEALETARRESFVRAVPWLGSLRGYNRSAHDTLCLHCRKISEFK